MADDFVLIDIFAAVVLSHIAIDDIHQVEIGGEVVAVVAERQYPVELREVVIFHDIGDGVSRESRCSAFPDVRFRCHEMLYLFMN